MTAIHRQTCSPKFQPPVQSTDSYIAFSAKRQLTDIRDHFDAALRQLKLSGRYQQLVDEAVSSAQ